VARVYRAQEKSTRCACAGTCDTNSRRHRRRHRRNSLVTPMHLNKQPALHRPLARRHAPPVAPPQNAHRSTPKRASFYLIAVTQRCWRSPYAINAQRLFAVLRRYTKLMFLRALQTGVWCVAAPGGGFSCHAIQPLLSMVQPGGIVPSVSLRQHKQQAALAHMAATSSKLRSGLPALASPPWHVQRWLTASCLSTFRCSARALTAALPGAAYLNACARRRLAAPRCHS